ncbi:hypothetical protein ACHAQC_009836 [Fusarium culmorum]
MTDIDEAIEHAKKSIAAEPTNVEYLKQLGNLLNDRHVSTGMLADLDASILTTKQAIDAIINDDIDLADCSKTLSYRLQDRFLITEDNTDLEEAIRMAQKAVELTTTTRSGNARYLSNLAASLKMRFSVTGEPRDMEDGIVLAKKAVSVTTSSDLELPKWLNNLGNHLSNRYLGTGSMEDLEEAINLNRRAVATTSDIKLQALFLNNLSAKLDLKGEVTGNANTYEEAIEVAKKALALTPDGHSDQAKWLNNLATHLIEKFDRSWDLDDLRDAIDVASKASDLTPNGPSKARYLEVVAGSLNRKYEKMGLLTDLKEAIRLTEMALEMLPTHHSKRPQVASTLSDLLSNKYLRNDTIQDLDRAIELSREAADANSDNNPYKAIYLDRLAMQLNLRSEMLNTLGYRLRDAAKNDEDLEKASACFLEALQNKNAPTITRVRAGSALLQCCPDKQKAYQAAQVIMGLLPQLITRSHETSDKQHAAGSRAGMTCSAAAAALQADRPLFEALQVLEMGRGVLAKYSEEMLFDPVQLGLLSPEQAKTYSHLRDELQVSNTLSQGSSLEGRISQMNKRHSVATELEELIVEIRKLPGFEDLWTAPTEAEIFEAAAYGPVVAINISDGRCDAIIITKDQMRSLALRNITNDLHQFARKSDFGSSRILEWMWDHITGPILDALGYSHPPGEGAWPHVWWIPTDLLTLFPLHAAGYHRRESSETVIDRVVSSYASSIRAIIRGRQNEISTRSTSTVVPRAMLVGMQYTPECGPLPFANKEVDIVQDLCKSLGLETVRPSPRKEDVSKGLLDCKVFHFAGHGATDEEDPSNSHLLLEDWKEDRFCVADLQRMNLREHAPFLAYLSACGTGQMKRYNLVDESIHLISAYQLAGFRHVIGTLWKVSDQCCVDIARVTYESMIDSGLSDYGVSWGLHRATRKLRDKWVKRQKQDGSLSERAVRVLRNDNINVAADRKYCKDESGRDIVMIEDDEPEVGEQLQWAPYVHFGV